MTQKNKIYHTYQTNIHDPPPPVPDLQASSVFSHSFLKASNRQLILLGC